MWEVPWVPIPAYNPANEGYQDPTGAEAMATGGGSSMERQSLASATGAGGLQHAQVHQEVDGVGSGLELVPAGQPEVYGPATSTVVEEVNPFGVTG